MIWSRLSRRVYDSCMAQGRGVREKGLTFPVAVCAASSRLQFPQELAFSICGGATMRAKKTGEYLSTVVA